MVFGCIFIVSKAPYLLCNLKPLKRYLADLVRGELNLSHELMAVLFMTCHRPDGYSVAGTKPACYPYPSPINQPKHSQTSC